MCCLVKVTYLPIVWAWALLQLAVSAYNNVPDTAVHSLDVKTRSQGFSVSKVGRPVKVQWLKQV